MLELLMFDCSLEVEFQNEWKQQEILSTYLS